MIRPFVYIQYNTSIGQTYRQIGQVSNISPSMHDMLTCDNYTKTIYNRLNSNLQDFVAHYTHALSITDKLAKFTQ